MICYSKYDFIIKFISCEFLFYESFGKGIKILFIIYIIIKYGMNDYFIICFQFVFMFIGKYLFLQVLDYYRGEFIIICCKVVIDMNLKKIK